MADKDTSKKVLDYGGLLYFWQQIRAKFTAELGKKVDKVDGKGLSTNDYTTAEKDKLKGIAEGANKTTVTDALTSTSATNALSANQGKVLNDKIVEIDGKLGDLGYGDMLKSTYDTDGDGKVNSADDADKLGGELPATYAKANGSNIKTAFTMASARLNLVSQELLATSLGKIQKYFNDLKDVAFTGSYNDLTNTPDIPTVTNDLTDELKAHYDAAYNHSTQAHAPANAERNIIVGVKRNGQAVTPAADRTVNVVVPTKVTDLSDAGNYALKTDLSKLYEYKGSVASYENLPTGAEIGDVYNVEDTGANYAWNGKEWDNLGGSFAISYISNSDIDTILKQ